MTESTAVLAVTATPNPDEMEAMQTYLSRVGPILTDHGGQALYRGRSIAAVVGDLSFGMLLVMKFESVQAIQGLFASPEYQELIPFREKGFKKFDAVISSAS